MTRDELIQISERIRDHLIKQGVPAMEEGTGCVYHHGNGNKCAVGCLVVAEHYNPEMEENGVDELVVRKAVNASIGKDMTELGYAMLYRWQNYHDNAFTLTGDDGPAVHHDSVVAVLSSGKSDKTLMESFYDGI